MADWGLYSALRGTDDWATKRQDQQMNLLAAEKMESRQQTKVAQSAAAEASIAKYMEELQNLETTPEDQERVTQAEKRARQNIVKGIANANGDLRKYMSTGGITALNEYKTNVMQSEEVKQANVNSLNLKNYLSQEAKGNQRHKFVDVSVPLTDENGNPVLDAEGNQQSENKKMTWQEQYNLYKEGKIKQLNYSGSETRVNLGIQSFGNQYKNSANIYQKDNFVTESNVYEKMLSEGASKEYAIEQAKRYGNMEKAGGDAWRWKAGDQTELRMKQEQLSMQRRRLKLSEDAAKQASNKTLTTHEIPAAILKLKEGETHSMGVKELELWNKTLQLDKSETRGNFFPYKMIAKDALVGDDINLSSATNVFFDEIVARDAGDGVTNKFIKATVTIPDPSGLWMGVGEDYGDLPLDDTFWITDTKSDAHARNWSDDGSGNYTGDVLIPIDKYMNDVTFQTTMDKFIGNNTAAQYLAPSYTNAEENAQSEYYAAYLQSQVEGLDQALIDRANGTFDNIDALPGD